MKKITLFLFFCANLSFGQTFYDENTIQDIRIVFSQSNWDALLDAAEASDAYVQATSVTINGTLIENVGVKYKGNSSYNASYNKNPFHIELDTYQDQDYQGYTDIKLNNVIYDPSFVRETVAYNITRKYMHAPLSNYANVYVNGTLIGLYTNVESISKKFVDSHFGSKTNAFFNCSPPAGAGPSTTNLPNLAYLGTNSTSYESAYEMKSDTGWDDLINLTNTLSNNVTNIETILDVDRALWMLALDNVMVNLDSYIGQFKQNYYLYKDDNGRFNPIKWDFNMCFGTFNMTGSSGSSGTLTTTTSKRQLSHTLHSTESSWPLVQKLLAVPTYKKKYLAHYKTILTENFSNNSYYATAQAFQTLISASVSADPNKFYTTAQFTSNMTTDVSVGMNTAPGLSNLMPGRVTYLSALSDFTATQPTISNVTTSNNNPMIGNNVNFNATVTNVTGSSVYLGYRTDALLPFNKITLYDDGAHNDGVAGDNIYGNSITISSVTTQYYIYGENTTIGKFSPERAEHEYYTLTATYPTITPGDLVVNEIMAQNTNTVTDPHGDYSDWFELYNNSTNTISLDYLYATDDPTNLLKWQFPSGLTIAPNSYLIVWADEDLNQDGIHADFKFSAAGESCILSYSDGTIVDSVTFGVQTANMGYARIPNGTGNFVIQAPTYNANNESLSISSEVFNQSLITYPNPTSGNLTIENSQFNIEKVEIFNLQGQLLYSNKYENSNLLNLDFSSYSNGMYLVVINSNTNIKIIKN
ncbi:CotH kinase family protein [Flavobacterium sp. N2270]|uniref:CotH kinase family protein n=1 Tax=Flavobacterium sp. N2270 TaxID=2986831 RepID=UPI0022244710|nr:CotH kinase family protein [Flavobacterium sp. N2270]